MFNQYVNGVHYSNCDDWFFLYGDIDTRLSFVSYKWEHFYV